MRKLLFVLILGCSMLLALPAAAQDTAPTFETSKCMFTVPIGFKPDTFALPDGNEPECGYVIVPEDRTQPDSPTIKLATAVFRSTNPDKSPYPLVYLEGGPGGSVLELLSLTFKDRFGEFIKDRDIIVFDQRGVGRSQPALDCKEFNDASLEILDKPMTTDEVLQVTNDSMIACAERLRADGINLSAYNSAENAADVNDLRLALGYDQIDLYGISYGTRLALTVIRDFPEALHSVIIDSINPPETSYFDVSKDFARALAVLFRDCTADTACNTTYPNLEQVFYETIEQLNETPAKFEVVDPSTQRIRKVQLDGDGFAGYIFEALYATALLPTLPKTIYAVHDGSTEFLSLWTLQKLVQIDMVSFGMNYAVQCNEEIPFDGVAHIEATLDETTPALRNLMRRIGVDPTQLDVCAVWNPAKLNPLENEPVISDVPTLIVSGEYDPVTPPENGVTTAANLSNSYFFEFPGSGHGVIATNPCALSIAQDFLADPTTKPASACIDELKAPVFSTGQEVAPPIEFETFTNESADFTAIKPVGWKDVGLGTFARTTTPLDQTAITFQVLPGGNVDFVLPLIGFQLGLDTKDIVLHEVNGLKWRLLGGEIQGISVRMAITDHKGKIYMILVFTNKDEVEIMEETLFMPAVDAFVPAK